MKNAGQRAFGKSSISDNHSLDSENDDQLISVKKDEAAQDSDTEILQAYNDIVSVKPNSLKISINKKATRK